MRSRNIVTIMALAAVLTFSSIAVRQAAGQGNAGTGGRTSASGNDSIALPSIPPPEGWLSCPRCQNNDDRARAWEEYEVDGQQFDPRDLSGVWGWGPDNTNASAFDDDNVPALTEIGEQQRQTTFADEGRPLRSKDTSGRGSGSLVNCDPYSWPRLYAYNFGFEFMVTPDRVLQFFELGHTWRTIWTDGNFLSFRQNCAGSDGVWAVGKAIPSSSSRTALTTGPGSTQVVPTEAGRIATR